MLQGGVSAGGGWEEGKERMASVTRRDSQFVAVAAVRTANTFTDLLHHAHSFFFFSFLAAAAAACESPRDS